MEVHVGTCELLTVIKLMCRILEMKITRARQLDILKESFRANPYPRSEDKDQLAQSLNISRNVVSKWFRNMRQRKPSESVISKSE